MYIIIIERYLGFYVMLELLEIIDVFEIEMYGNFFYIT